MRWLLVVGSLLVSSLMTNAAWSKTVLLVRPASPTALVAEAIVRIQGELASEGIDVRIGSAEAGANLRTSLERSAGEDSLDAIVELSGNNGPEMVEVWAVDKASGRSVIRRVPFRSEAGQSAEILAIRAIELLRASFLEVDMAVGEDARPATVPTLAPSAAVLRAGEPTRDIRHETPIGFGIELGGSLVQNLGGGSPLVLPTLRLDWAMRPWLVLQANLAGMGFRSHVDGATGSADVSQQTATLGGAYQVQPGARACPFASLGIGVLHTSADGSAEWPYQGREVGQWSFLIDVGVGMRIPLRNRFEVAVDGHAQFAKPYPQVHFADAESISYTRPSLLLDLTFVAWL